MNEIDLRGLDDKSFTVRFGGAPSEIDVYTIAAALTGIADALREINEIVNPDVELEISLSSTAEGSFLARLRLKKSTRNVLARIGEPIVIGLLVNYLFSAMTYEKPTYKVVGDELVVETQHEKLRFPKSVFDFKDEVATKPVVAQGVKKAVDAAQQDEAVSSFGIVADNQPAVEVGRRDFNHVIAKLERAIDIPGTRFELESIVEASATRTVLERAKLTIIKAVLKRSRRKWQFNWNGIDISAAIIDQTFFDRLESREITIAQGDALDVDLSITQFFDPSDRVWRNTLYEVVRVHGLIEGPRQTSLGLSDDRSA